MAIVGLSDAASAMASEPSGRSTKRQATTARNVTIRLTLPRFRSCRTGADTQATASVASRAVREIGMIAHIATSIASRMTRKTSAPPSVDSPPNGSISTTGTGE